MKKVTFILALGLFSFASFAKTNHMKAKPTGCVQIRLSCGQGSACGRTVREIAQTAADMEKVYCGK